MRILPGIKMFTAENTPQKMKKIKIKRLLLRHWGSFRDSRAPSWVSGPRTDVPLIGRGRLFMIKIDSIFYTTHFSVPDVNELAVNMFLQNNKCQVYPECQFFVIYNYLLLLFLFYPVIREITFLSVTNKNRPVEACCKNNWSRGLISKW